MRYSVLVPDLVIYFTAVLMLIFFSNGFSSLVSMCIAYICIYTIIHTGLCVTPLLFCDFQGVELSLASLLLILIQPCLLLTDYGHFQYNCISLGLALWGVVGVTSNWDLVGAAAFCLAINYKQMELYHSLPFFFYLLGKSCKWCIRTSIGRIVKLGLVVISIFWILWIPFYLVDGIRGLQHVLSRIFPFNRGLFEDKVASFWCAISFLVKMKQIFSIPILLKVSLMTTLFSSIPSLLMVLWNPTSQRFILSLVCLLT